MKGDIEAATQPERSSLLESDDADGSAGAVPVLPWLLRRAGRQQDAKADARKGDKPSQAEPLQLTSPQDFTSSRDELNNLTGGGFRQMMEAHTSEELRWCLLGTVILILVVVCLFFVSRTVPVHRLSKVADLHHTVTHRGPVDVAAARPPLFDQPDCFTENRYLWEPAQRMWCCREVGIGCSLTSMPFDCHHNLANFEVEWSAEKQQWCCAAEGVACL